MLTQRFLNIYGLVGIVFMAVVFLLVWFKIVPPSFQLPLLLVALFIWASRLVMRILLARKERQEKSGIDVPPGS